MSDLFEKTVTCHNNSYDVGGNSTYTSSLIAFLYLYLKFLYNTGTGIALTDECPVRAQHWSLYRISLNVTGLVIRYSHNTAHSSAWLRVAPLPAVSYRCVVCVLLTEQVPGMHHTR